MRLRRAGAERHKRGVAQRLARHAERHRQPRSVRLRHADADPAHEVGDRGAFLRGADAELPVRLLDLLDLGPDVDVETALAECLLELLPERFVLERHEAGEDLDDGDLGAERGVDGRELDADRPGSEHGERGGNAGKRQRVIGVDDPLAVELDRPALQRLDGCLQNLLRRQSVRGAAVDLLRFHTCTHLLQKDVDTVSEGVLKVAETAEYRVGVHNLFQVAGRVQGRFAPHIVDHKPPACPGHFAALHRVPALDFVAAGQPADHAVLKAHAEMGGGPDRSGGR